jgi:hypothetical protein
MGMADKIDIERIEPPPQSRVLFIDSVWSWVGESDTVHFILRGEGRKMEIVLGRGEHSDLYDFIIDNWGPVDESGAPRYIRRPQ